MSITATELKNNSEKHLNQNRVDLAKSLFGILPSNIISEKEAREERLSKV